MKIGNNFNNIPSSVNRPSNPMQDFKNFLLQVDSEIKKSEKLKTEFLVKKDIPIYEVMLQSQKAKISLELIVKIRDEALKAYNEIINMRI